MFFWGSPEARLEKKRQSYLNKITHSDHLGRLTVTLLFEGKSLTEILLDKRIEEYLYSEEQFECVMHFIDADANTLLQKK